MSPNQNGVFSEEDTKGYCPQATGFLTLTTEPKSRPASSLNLEMETKGQALGSLTENTKLETQKVGFAGFGQLRLENQPVVADLWPFSRKAQTVCVITLKKFYPRVQSWGLATRSGGLSKKNECPQQEPFSLGHPFTQTDGPRPRRSLRSLRSSCRSPIDPGLGHQRAAAVPLVDVLGRDLWKLLADLTLSNAWPILDKPVLRNELLSLLALTLKGNQKDNPPPHLGGGGVFLAKNCAPKWVLGCYTHNGPLVQAGTRVKEPGFINHG